MAVDRSVIGSESEPVVYEVERGALRKFADAIGDPNPAYQRGDIAPPTYPTTFRIKVPGVDLDPKRILHGGEEYEYMRPIRAGDRLTVVRRVTDTFEKQGSIGHMTFYVVEGEGVDAEGELVFRSRSTIIYR